ncbi:metallophosphatase family protein [Candidatus Dependentiae bacterium]|nr:MAG: metallophosphatase family protein [Candidatus Dependentiae bacterium]
MNITIIPDIHHHIKEVEQILYAEAADKVVFLGDWFDDFYDDEAMSAKTALWLTNRMDRHKEDVFIWGNHDVHYGFPFPGVCCSGYEQSKCDAIRDIMRPRHWDRFVFHHWEGSWLMSHAGLTKSHTAGVTDIRSWLEGEEEAAQLALRRGMKERHWIFTAGMARGGRAPFGGLTWCDVNEFVPIAGINQVFGHTPQPGRVWKYDTKRRSGNIANSENYCIDTHLACYARIVDGTFELRERQIPKVPNCP